MNPPPQRKLPWVQWITPLVVFLVGSGGLYWMVFHGPLARKTNPETQQEKEETTPENMVRFDPDRWQVSGIELGKIEKKPFVQRVWRTARLGVDETKIAHLSPVVEGLLREVRVRLGQRVEATQALAVMDCREVGQAKLELVKVKMALEFAQSQYDRTQQSTRNALAMVEAMLANTPIVDIENQFRDRPIGDLRQQLMTAYSRRLQAKSQYDSLVRPESRGAVSEATIVKVRSEYETTESAYRALCEETKNQGKLQILASEQKLREAQNAHALARVQLMMFGYQPDEVDKMDPLREGSAVSLFPIRAPFSGTIIEQHAVIAERVNPNHQLFQLADLNRLWLQANLYEGDLPFVNGLVGKKVRFRTTVPGSPQGEAEVFSVGGAIDPTTRTLPIIASVDNSAGQFKAGMFAEMELTQLSGETIVLPLEAIQRDGREAFVFLQEGKDLFRKTPVTLGRESEGMQEILGGIENGTTVVLKGGFILKSEMLKELIAGE